jgi:hypothetical protein
MYSSPIPPRDWNSSYEQLPNNIIPIFDTIKAIDLPPCIDPKIACNQICGAIFVSVSGNIFSFGGEQVFVQLNICTLDCPIDIISTQIRGSDNLICIYRSCFTDDTRLLSHSCNQSAIFQ